MEKCTSEGLREAGGFSAAAVMSVKLIGVQDGDKNYMRIKEVKTCQQR